MLRIDAQVYQVHENKNRVLIYITDIKRDECIVPIQRIILTSTDIPNFITFYVHETKNVEVGHFYLIPIVYESREYHVGSDLENKPAAYSDDKVSAIILIEWIYFNGLNEIDEAKMREISKDNAIMYPITLRVELPYPEDRVNFDSKPHSVKVSPLFLLASRFKFVAEKKEV